MHDADSYERACNRATTDQGLDGVTACLRMAGLPVDVDQTGGFTMCTRVDRPNHGGYIYITWNGNDANDTNRSFLVGQYSDNEDDYESLHCADDLTISEVVSLAARFVNGICVGCGMRHTNEHECEPPRNRGSYLGRCVVCETTVWSNAPFGDGGRRAPNGPIHHVCERSAK
jgi:hypothetical protein